MILISFLKYMSGKNSMLCHLLVVNNGQVKVLSTKYHTSADRTNLHGFIKAFLKNIDKCTKPANPARKSSFMLEQFHAIQSISIIMSKMLKFLMLNETENKQKNMYKSKKPPLREGPKQSWAGLKWLCTKAVRFSVYSKQIQKRVLIVPSCEVSSYILLKISIVM